MLAYPLDHKTIELLQILLEKFKSITVKIFFSLVVVSCSLFLFSSLNVAKSLNSNKNLNYYYLINEAESYVLNEDYSNALKNYKYAFKINSKPYAKYCFTAAQVSATCNALDDFIFFTRKAFKSGITYTDIKNDRIFIDFIKQNQLENKLVNYYVED